MYRFRSNCTKPPLQVDLWKATAIIILIKYIFPQPCIMWTQRGQHFFSVTHKLRSFSLQSQALTVFSAFDNDGYLPFQTAGLSLEKKIKSKLPAHLSTHNQMQAQCRTASTSISQKLTFSLATCM